MPRLFEAANLDVSEEMMIAASEPQVWLFSTNFHFK